MSSEFIKNNSIFLEDSAPPKDNNNIDEFKNNDSTEPTNEELANFYDNFYN